MNAAASVNFAAYPPHLQRLAWGIYNSSDRTEAYAQWIPGNERRRGQWVCAKAGRWKGAPTLPLTPEVALAHLVGLNAGIGTYMVDRDNNVRRAVIDIDAHYKDEDTQERRDALIVHAHRQLAAIMSAVAFAGLRPMLFRSKSGNGFHVEFGFAQPIPAAAGRRLLFAVMKQANCERIARESGLFDAAKISKFVPEVYPKQDTHTAVGNQVARPGGLHFVTITGGRGSVLIDPSSLAPIPIEWWADIYTAIPPLSDEDVRRAGLTLAGEDPFAEPTRQNLVDLSRAPTRSFSRTDRAFGEHDRWRAGDYEAFIAHTGLRVLENRSGDYADPRWTHRHVFAECPYADRHGSSDRSGAAAFFDDRTGRLGFKCQHNSCSDTGWAEFRARFDPGRTWRAPSRLNGPRPRGSQAATWHEPAAPAVAVAPAHHAPTCPDWQPQPPPPDPETCGQICPDVVPAPQKTKSPGLSKAWQEQAEAYSKRHQDDADPDKRRLSKRVGTFGLCCSINQYETCPHHGPMGVQTYRCDENFLCPNCNYMWSKRNKENVETWPERFVVGEVEKPHGVTRREAAAHRARMQKRAFKGVRAGFRWIETVGKYIIVCDVEHEPYLRSVATSVRVVDRDDGAKIVFAALRAINELVMSKIQEYADANPGRNGFEGIDNARFMTEPGIKGTGANVKGRALFPWISTAKAREKEKAKRLEQNGVPAGKCPAVHVNPDGSQVRCACNLSGLAVFNPTGEAIASKRNGLFRGLKEIRLELDKTDILPRYFRGDAPPTPYVGDSYEPGWDECADDSFCFGAAEAG